MSKESRWEYNLRATEERLNLFVCGARATIGFNSFAFSLWYSFLLRGSELCISSRKLLIKIPRSATHFKKMSKYLLIINSLQALL